jgi:hypothetical protein
MVNISNCPQSGLARKVTKDLQKLESAKQVILECRVFYFNAQGKKINTRGIHEYVHKLTAHNGIYVNPFSVGADAGKKWTLEQTAAYDAAMKAIADHAAAVTYRNNQIALHTAWENADPQVRGNEPVIPPDPGAAPAEPALKPMGQYDFFYALSKMKVNMEELELREIAEADAAGKFDDLAPIE